ncbi:MAG TPA: hypothetical protein VH327_07065 [Gammaproteobacteria bacterium]|jgi:uncharacterized lipoprotein|nr:hypothetical protein [Gammaproteobacteria bacterium]
MTNRFLISFTPPAIALLLASCSFGPNCGNSHPYKNYVAGAPLKAPTGVTLPPADAAYQVPAAGTRGAPAATTSAEPCMVTPPSVLTRQDMAKPGSPAPAKATAVPGAVTQAPAKPAPAAASHPRPVAGLDSME